MRYNKREDSVSSARFHHVPPVQESGSDRSGGSSEQLQPDKSSSEDISETEPPPEETPEKYRNLLAFWILGVCNNFGYVIMLSAAFDLLHPDHHGEKQVDYYTVMNSTNETVCNPISTGAILLADIIPSLLIKMIAPFIVVSIFFRIIVAICLSFLSLIVTSVSVNHGMTFAGVVLCSLSSGLGEVTFLSYSSYYHRNVVSAWASGTGGAGVAGALSYASLSYVLSPARTLQVMLVVPLLMFITYIFILDPPPSMRVKCSTICKSDKPTKKSNKAVKLKHTFREQINLIKPLLKYMVPLFIVYFAEYFINQGLLELLYFRNANQWLNHKQQYRWYMTTYQFGVLVSRSSVNLFRIKTVWVFPILQVINLVVLLFQVFFPFIPVIWIVLAVVLWEGLVGGATYVNSFFAVTTEIPEKDREFSMGVTSLADTMGIAFAGAVAVYTHDALCKLPAYTKPV
ncbi:battenin-like [Uloborus diversus]|uniref:battenin-like n=1 Tax=Uloborus diversus TaxID=327109 RepID=UPI00240A974F|nr:battenin-like [Uloborus diversus]